MCLSDIYGAPADNKYASPLLHPRLNELRRVYISTCGADTLRDDGRLLKDRLEQDKYVKCQVCISLYADQRPRVTTQYDEYEGLPHYFFSYPSSHLDRAREHYYQNTAKGMSFVAS